MLDGKQHNWATNTFYWKYEVSLCNIHVRPNCLFLFISGLKEGKTDNANDFKMSWATYCSRTILDSAKQTKW